MANEDGDSVEIMGCPNGIDWTIKHLENNQVKHISEKGNEAIINKKEYQKLVIEFVDEIEAFYQKSEAKEIPNDEFDEKDTKHFGKNGID